MENLSSSGSKGFLGLMNMFNLSKSDTIFKQGNLVGAQANTLPTIAPNPSSDSASFSNKPETNKISIKGTDERLLITKRDKTKIERVNKVKLNKLDEAKFIGVDFLLYDEETLKESVVEITNSNLNGDDTVNDRRMGTVSRDQLCSTCTNTVADCRGHSGRIVLRSPYSPPIFQRLVVRVLNSICVRCCRLKVTADMLEIAGYWKWIDPNDHSKGKRWTHNYEDRLKHIEDYILSQKIKCREIMTGSGQHCGDNLSFKLIRDPPRILYQIADGPFTPISLEQVRAILDNIPEEDSILLGFDPPARPSRLIYKYLMVPPLCVRAPMTRDGQVHADDLTKLYKTIVEKNNKISVAKIKQGEKDGPLPKIIIPNDPNRDGNISILHKEINKLIYGAGGTNDRDKSIKKLVQGKEGIIRRSMMGKRGDYSARTVLSPGPTLEYGEIGIPQTWSSILTVPVEVTAENREGLMQLIKDGKVSKIRLGKEEGHQIRIDPNNLPDYQIQPGDSIERHMQNGDYIAFNRNPSLHKYSLMGYKIRLHPGLTIKLHIGSTPHHNADFDGDEGNAYMWRTYEGEAELKTIMNSKYCIISPQDNKPLTGLVFNDLTAVYKLTLETTIVNEETWNVCLNIIRDYGNSDQLVTLDSRIEKYGLRKHSGRALFSAMLPDDFYYEKAGLLIVEGIIINGNISKQQAGITHRSILQFLFKNYGEERASEFITVSQWVLKEWLKDEPVTTSLADCYPKAEPEKEVVPLFEIIKNKDKLQYLDENLCRNIMEHHSNRVHFDTVEERAAILEINMSLGQKLISALLPIDFDIVIDNEQIINNGILLIEPNTKEEAKLIYDTILINLSKTKGNENAIGFIKDIKLLATRCLDINLKVGKHYELIANELENANSILEQYGPKLRDPNPNIRKQTEKFIIAQLNRVGTIGKTTLEENLDPDNNFALIVDKAKTKGGPENIGQTNAIIGFQFKGNELISAGGETIYQDTDDMDPRGFGFVSSNFLEGLTPLEFFFHAMAGREGMVDTSIKTATPGMLTRMIVKNLEGVMILNDNTVRLTNGKIIQMFYGDTCLDPTYLINSKFNGAMLPFFIDLESVAHTINTRHGYTDLNRN